MPAVSIVILNWNGRDDTLDCLRSIQRVDYPHTNVLVVDNASTDGSVEAIRAEFPTVEVVQTGANLGFAGGNNAGIRRALNGGADYILLLNNDTVVDPDLLTAFVSAAQRYPGAAAFSGKIYFHEDPRRIWYAGASWDWGKSCFVQIGEGQEDTGPEFGTVRETAYACGCALFVPSERFAELGLLDEDFFLYFEETDWCYRARSRGYPSIFVPDAKVWHKVSVSFGGERSPLAVYFLTRNRLLWAKRHGSLGQRARLYASTASTLALRFLSPFTARQANRLLSPKERWWGFRAALRDPRNRAYLLGVRDYLFGRFGDCPPVVRELSRQWSIRSANMPTAYALPHQRSVNT